MRQSLRWLTGRLAEGTDGRKVRMTPLSSGVEGGLGQEEERIGEKRARGRVGVDGVELKKAVR